MPFGHTSDASCITSHHNTHGPGPVARQPKAAVRRVCMRARPSPSPPWPTGHLGYSSRTFTCHAPPPARVKWWVRPSRPFPFMLRRSRRAGGRRRRQALAERALPVSLPNSPRPGRGPAASRPLTRRARRRRPWECPRRLTRRPRALTRRGSGLALPPPRPLTRRTPARPLPGRLPGARPTGPPRTGAGGRGPSPSCPPKTHPRRPPLPWPQPRRLTRQTPPQPRPLSSAQGGRAPGRPCTSRTGRR